MQQERDLDFYVSTPDEHFNHNAQHFYFQFSGSKKPNTDKSFEVFIDAIFVAYFFAIQNSSKPFQCIELIKKIGIVKKFNNSDMVIFMDLLLGVISNKPDLDEYSKIYIQLVDYRHELSPYNFDDESENNFFDTLRFNVDEIKNTVKETIDPIKRMKCLTGIYFDFKGSECLMNEIEKEYYISEGLLEFLNAEIERVEFDLKISEASVTTASPKQSSIFKIASRRKTDVVKILSAMYDIKMFADADGKSATNKQQLMEAFGAFFGEDLTSYSTLLSQAKDKDRGVFLKPYEEIFRAGKNYFELD